MKLTYYLAVLLLLTCICFSKISYTQNIKFYKNNSSVAVSTIDFDKDSILHIAIKADSSLLGFDMLMLSTTLSRKNGKKKWVKVNNLMPKTFYGRLKNDGYYHFVAFRKLGNGLSYSEIGLTSEDFRFGKLEMNTSVSGKKLSYYFQYEADVIDFSLPITVERYDESANIRTKRIVGGTFAIIGLACLIVSPALIIISIL
jgi:hypothetical protein